MPKEKIEFDLPEDIEYATKLFGCIESIESLFDIEFSCGDGLFISDIEDMEDADLMQKYDGMVCLKAIRINGDEVIDGGYAIRLSCTLDDRPEALNKFSDFRIKNIKSRRILKK